MKRYSGLSTGISCGGTAIVLKMSKNRAPFFSKIKKTLALSSSPPCFSSWPCHLGRCSHTICSSFICLKSLRQELMFSGKIPDPGDLKRNPHASTFHLGSYGSIPLFILFHVPPCSPLQIMTNDSEHFMGLRIHMEHLDWRQFSESLRYYLHGYNSFFIVSTAFSMSSPHWHAQMWTHYVHGLIHLFNCV